MWPFRRVHTAGCTRLTPRCSGGDLRCGCQDPNRLRSAEAAAAEDAEIPAGGGGVADDGEGLSWRRSTVRRRLRQQQDRAHAAEAEEDGDPAFSEVVSSWTLISEKDEECNSPHEAWRGGNRNEHQSPNEMRHSHCRLQDTVSSSSPSPSWSSSSSSTSSACPPLSSLSTIAAWCLVLVLISCCAVQPTAACSSRSTPKPRPPSQSAIRPNITFQTYACPPAYAAWYCLNGATCFTVKIADSILYNCECADGYMGQRCEFKDLDGTYLPTRERLIAELTHSRPGQIFLGSMFVILAAAGISAIFTTRRTKRKRRSNGDSFDEGDVSGYEEEEDNAHNHHLDDSGIGSCDIFPTSVVGSVPAAAAATALPCPAVQSISYALSTRQQQHQQQRHAHAQYYGNCHNSPWSSSMPEGRYYGHNENLGLRRQH